MRILALDLGRRRIGVAVSDPSGMLVRSLGTIERSSRAQELAAIGELVERWEVKRIVVGYPRRLGGEAGPEARFAQAYAEALAKKLGLEVELWDERLSTFTAQHLLRERGIRGKEGRHQVDAVAAAVILEDYLEAHRPQASGPEQAPKDKP